MGSYSTTIPEIKVYEMGGALRPRVYEKRIYNYRQKTQGHT
jgi:hypothetical protein